MKDVKIIGITGGSGSGKSTIVRRIEEVCPDFVFIPQDNYYKSASFVSNKNITDYNFDRPDAIDSKLFFEHLSALKQWKSIEMPQYDFVHHSREDRTVHLDPAPLVIVEGLMILYEPEIRNLLDLKIYVDTPDDIRFIRRLLRDINERGRTLDSVVKQYLNAVRPGHASFIEPTKEYADLIIPEGGQNENALQVLITFVKEISKRD
ncbi:MAG: uridine kinase [Spirochaetales bacterium]|nr:uridine kinase [Spirochaetales bacterium]MBO6049645.1 uridine kinase [Spirochaetales bacterium]MBO7348824.1 uridine kinase [Spirochaetales bacterium]